MTITNLLPSPTYTGTAIQCTGTFTNPGSNTPVDPSGVTFKYAVEGAGIAETTWIYGGAGNITRVSTGVYQATVTANLAGNWTFEWQGTGAVDVTNAVTIPVVAAPL